MRKLVCFGDSFIAPIETESYITKLANKLNVDKVVNYGMHGSSLHYSWHKFYEYLRSDEYHKMDYIIFALTSGGRIPLVHEDIPPMAANILLRDDGGNNLKHLRLREFVKSWVQYYNEDLHNAHLTSLTAHISTLPNKTLAMLCFDAPIKIPHSHYCLPEGSLMNFALQDGSWPGREYPENHLSPEMHILLSDMIYDHFKNNIKLDLRPK